MGGVTTQRGLRVLGCSVGGHCVAQWGLRVPEFKVILNYTENLRLAWAIRDPVKNSREKNVAAATGLLYQPEAQVRLPELPAWLSHRFLEPRFPPSHSGVILSVSTVLGVYLSYSVT